MRLHPLPTIAVVAGAALALSGVALLAAPGALAAPSLSISDSTLSAGQTVTVKASGFPSAPTSLYMTLCENPPGATNCDVNLAHVKQITYDGSGGFTTKFKVAVTSFDTAAGKIDCAKVQCVIGTTNALSPKDRSYNAVAKFTVAGSGGSDSKPTPKPTKSQGDNGNSGNSAADNSGTSGGAETTAGTSDKDGAASESSALASTGATGGPSVVPLVGAAGLAALLGGLLLMIGVRPAARRGRHAR